MVIEGMAMVTKSLHIYFTSGTTNLLPFSPYVLFNNAYYAEFQLVKHFISGCDFVHPPVDEQTSVYQ